MRKAELLFVSVALGVLISFNIGWGPGICEAGSSPKVIFSDDFDDGDISDWTDTATGDASFGVSTAKCVSAPCSVHMQSTGDYKAMGVSPCYDVNLSEDYNVSFHFLLPHTNNHWFEVFNNHQIYVLIDSGTDLKCYLPIQSVMTLGTNQWYHIEIKAHQSSSNYDVYVDGEYKKTCPFWIHSGHETDFQIGDRAEGSSDRGEAYWDDITITQGLLLSQGWNLVSFIISPVADPDDPNDAEIPLKEGWNMFGHSSDEPFEWEDALVSNGIETKTVEEAATAGWLESTIYYYENGQYKFVPGDDDYIYPWLGYWLYSNEDELSLIISRMGGTLESQPYDWMDVQIDDGSETKSIEEAQSAGWLQGAIYYFDEDSQYYKFIPGDDDYIYPWRGYWLYSNEDDLVLRFPEPDPCNVYDYNYDFDLKIHNTIIGGDANAVCTPDTFNARYKFDDPNISDVNDVKDVRQPGGPPYADYVQAYTLQAGLWWTMDCKQEIRKWPIRLIGFDDAYVGLSGTNRLSILNPEEIDKLPEDTRIYLVDHGSDANGFVAQLDLRDPNNYCYEFPVTDVLGTYRYVDLVIIGCKDVNIDEIGCVNFKDFSIMAPEWRETGAGLAGDINWDGVVDFKDLEILANFWLCECN